MAKARSSRLCLGSKGKTAKWHLRSRVLLGFSQGHKCHSRTTGCKGSCTFQPQRKDGVDARRDVRLSLTGRAVATKPRLETWWILKSTVELYTDDERPICSWRLTWPNLPFRRIGYQHGIGWGPGASHKARLLLLSVKMTGLLLGHACKLFLGWKAFM